MDDDDDAGEGEDKNHVVRVASVIFFILTICIYDHVRPTLKFPGAVRSPSSIFCESLVVVRRGGADSDILMKPGSECS